jgi:hypothetical protein
MTCLFLLPQFPAELQRDNKLIEHLQEAKRFPLPERSSVEASLADASLNWSMHQPSNKPPHIAFAT